MAVDRIRCKSCDCITTYQAPVPVVGTQKPPKKGCGCSCHTAFRMINGKGQ